MSRIQTTESINRFSQHVVWPCTVYLQRVLKAFSINWHYECREVSTHENGNDFFDT